MINSQYNSPPSAATVVSCGSWSDHHPSRKSSPFYRVITHVSINYPPANQLDQPLLLPAKIQSLPQTNPNIIWPYI